MCGNQTTESVNKDERITRARDAMVLAVQVFNSVTLKFKSEVFAILANVAWTYLLHEFYERKGVQIEFESGRTLLLSKMIERQDCPISDGIRNNLKALKIIRDDAEHKLLGRYESRWYGIFQACCLNFNKVLCSEFGDQFSLANDLVFTLQFTKLDIDQVATLIEHDVPAYVESIDAKLNSNLTEEQLSDLEYQFRVVYTLEASSKSRSHVEFFHSDSSKGKEIRNILVQQKVSDSLYPYKPSKVCELVSQRSGKSFSMFNHTNAWKHFQIRPSVGAKQPENTKKDYCIYHPAHGDYTYSKEWVEYLVNFIADEENFNRLRSSIRR